MFSAAIDAHADRHEEGPARVKAGHDDAVAAAAALSLPLHEVLARGGTVSGLIRNEGTGT